MLTCTLTQARIGDNKMLARRLRGGSLDEPSVYTSSGQVVHLDNATHLYAAYADLPHSQFRAYRGLARTTAKIAAGSHIALLHYVTKDVEHFIAKRTGRPVNWIKRPANFAGRPFTEPAVMAAYERDYKLDGTHAVCGEAARSKYAARSAQAWHNNEHQQQVVTEQSS